MQSNICIVSIQILRRSAPQNDKLLNCSQTPQQTGICNWRQRGKVEGKDARATAVCRNTIRLQPCEPKPRPAEARKTRPADFGTNPSATCESCVCKSTLLLNRANAACGAASPAKAEAASLRVGRLRLAQHCELQKTIFEKRLQTTQAYELQNRRTTKTGGQTTANKQRFLTLPRHYAASGLLNLRTTLTRAVTLVTLGQLFSDAKIADSAAGCRYRYIFCTVATMYPGLSAHTSELRNRRSHAIRGRSIPAENRHLTATNDQKKHVTTPAGGLTEKAIRHRRTKINHYLRAAYTPIKPSCSNTIS